MGVWEAREVGRYAPASLFYGMADILQLFLIVGAVWFANLFGMVLIGTVIWDLRAQVKGWPTVTDVVRQRAARQTWFLVLVTAIPCLALGLTLGHLLLQ